MNNKGINSRKNTHTELKEDKDNKEHENGIDIRRLY